jgi:phospholipase/carboxylesterase
MPDHPLFYIPAPFSSSADSLAPVLIFLHGRGSDEQDLLGLILGLDPRFRVFSVRAPYQYPLGGYTWFQMEHSLEFDILQVKQSAASLIATLDDIQQKYPIDSKKVFLFGFSMGAMMALLVALLQPSRFKGIVVHSGLLLKDEQLQYQTTQLSNLNFFIAHGTDDSVVPCSFGRKAQQWLLQTPAHVTYQEYSIPHTISDESLGDIARWLENLI